MNKTAAAPNTAQATPQFKLVFRVFRVIGQYPTAKAALTEHFLVGSKQADSLINDAGRKIYGDEAVFFKYSFIEEGIFGIVLTEDTGHWAALVSVSKDAFETAEAAKAYTDIIDKAFIALGEPSSRWHIVKNLEPAGSCLRLR
jgi:hypothetical protein